jgi:hypothetical protein
MRMVGGFIAIVGGACGLFAAMFSLVFGGLLAVFHVPSGANIVYFEWGGMIFSVIVMILGAFATCSQRNVGVVVVATAILGAVCGGLAVAICLTLAAVGGCLIIVASHRTNNATLTAKARQ